MTLEQLFAQRQPHGRQIVTPESIATGNRLNPNQALESSFLDPTMAFGGGAIIKGVQKGGQKLGKAAESYFNAAKNTPPGTVDLGRRGASLALGGGLAKIADPAFIPKSIGNAMGMGIDDFGLMPLVKTASNKVSNFAVDAARLKNYRLNIKAGNTPAQSAFLDKLATTKLNMSRPKNTLNKMSRINRVKEAGLQADVKDVGKILYDVNKY